MAGVEWSADFPTINGQKKHAECVEPSAQITNNALLCVKFGAS